MQSFLTHGAGPWVKCGCSGSIYLCRDNAVTARRRSA